MKRPSVLFGLTVILLIGLAVTISIVRAVDSDGQAVMEPEQNDVAVETQVASPELIFQELNKKALANFGRGWLYVNEYQIHDVDSLPSIEGLIPLVDTNTDMWYHLNSSGVVEQFVTIQRTMNGQIAQVGIYSNGTAWNTMVDEIVPMEPFLFEGIHYGLPNSHLKSPGMTVNNVLKGGESFTEFTIIVVEKEPIVMLDYAHPLVSMEHHYIFNTSTGFLVSKKTIAHLEDGSQRELDNIQIEIKTELEPPANVLKYFEAKKDREEQK